MASNATSQEISGFARKVLGALRDNSMLGKIFEWSLIAELKEKIERGMATSLSDVLQAPVDLHHDMSHDLLRVPLKASVVISEGLATVQPNLAAGTLLIPDDARFPTFDFAVVNQQATETTSAQVSLVGDKGCA